MRRYACLDRNKKIILLREINDDEHLDFTNLSGKFGNFQMEVDYIKIFNKAYRELIVFLDRFLQSKSSFDKFDFNRYTMNYLYGVKTFLDHWETHIKRDYRDNQEYNDLFKKVTGQEYDNHMAYRIVYRLRNYVQHCEMPISSVSERLNTNNEKEILVYVNRDRLISNFKEWKPEEVEYLKTLEQQFEILPLFEEMNSCLVRIHEQLINFNFNRKFIFDCISVLKLRKQFKEHQGTLAVIEYSDDGTRKEGQIFANDKTTLKIIQLPAEACEDILRMQIRNNERHIKIFNYSGVCIGETDSSFPYSIGKDENGTTLFVKGKDIIKIDNLNWIRLIESISFGNINEYIAVYADVRFGMKELRELTALYNDICEVLYKTS